MSTASLFLYVHRQLGERPSVQLYLDAGRPQENTRTDWTDALRTRLKALKTSDQIKLETMLNDNLALAEWWAKNEYTQWELDYYEQQRESDRLEKIIESARAKLTREEWDAIIWWYGGGPYG